MSEKKQKDPFRMKIIISPAKMEALKHSDMADFLPVPSGFCPPF